MRPSSRRRVASWLLALPSGRGEECARRGRLEMISFWLLCWKLLRATAGLRRTPELTDGSPGNGSPGNGRPGNGSPGNGSPGNGRPGNGRPGNGSPGNGSPGNGRPGNDNPVSDSPTPALDPVAMEISPSPPLTDLERENLLSCRSPEEQELHYPEGRAAEEQAAGEQNGKGDECDYLVFEIGEKGRERGGEEGGDRGETEGEDEGRGEVEGEEEGRGETEGGAEGRGEDEERRKVDGEDGSRGTDVWGRREVDGEDEGRRRTEGEDGGREEPGEGGGGGGVEEEDGWMGEMKDDTLSDLLLITDSSSAEPPDAWSHAPPAWSHAPGNRDDLSDGHLSDGHLSDGHLSDGHLSDGHLSDGHLSDGHLSDGHLSDGHLSDCLQAELAVVYSDSDAGEDQWAAFAPGDVSSQVEGELPDRSENEQVRGEEQEGETRREEQREQDRKEEEQMKTRRDLFLRSPSVSSTSSSTDPDRRVPADFSVHQDTLSEHVSTEHLDFLLARQQWRKMEEEVKGFPIPKPGLRAQSSFQGTHSSLYPPTRSPRLKHREVHPPGSREPPLSSTMSPSSEDSGLDDSSYRSPLEEPETAVEREIRMTLEREERHRKERGMIAQGLSLPRPSTLQTGRSPPRPPACRTPTLSISPSPSCSSSLPRSVYHEMTANNVIILEPDSSGSSSRSRLLSTAVGGLSDAVPSANVIVVETSNLIIRSASEFCLSSAPVSVETQESTFTSNPFFKLRSLSSQSLVEQEIRMVRQREEEWRKQREEMWRRRREEEWRRGRERYDTVLVSPGLTDSISFNVPEVPDRSVSSPSSPSRTRKMERSSLSCDHKFPPSLSSVPRRQNAMAQRWEASLLANQKKD